MYLPKVFQETDRARLFDLVERYSFGMLVVPVDGGAPEIAHLPFVLDREAGRLRVHAARANPIWRAALAAPQVTAVFAGPHGYVSPSWYERPREMVPTWNYAVVHVQGRAEGPLAESELWRLLEDLSAIHEDPRAPWRPADLEPAVRAETLPAIVGLSIAIARVDGKLKLSQNRSDADRARVIAAFEARGTPDDREMARLMRG